MAGLEEELAAQLAEQQEALGGVRALLDDDPSSEEMQALLAELQAGIADTMEALLGLKRQRLLLELDAMQAGTAADQQQQQQQQEQEQQTALAALQPGIQVIFRHTDGRHYWARVRSSQSGTAQLEWLLPTKAHQREPLQQPVEALHVTHSGLAPPSAAQLHAGLRVWVRPPGCSLWAAAEVASVDARGQRCEAVTLADKRQHVLPLTAVALAAHAPDPHGGSSDDDGGGGGGSLDFRAGDDWSSGSGEEGGSGSGSDAEESEGEGGATCARISWAHEAAQLQQQQQAAGVQTETRLFFASEAHSRGIGSKLLARMGFRGHGHGLGAQQQGIQQALEATLLKKGAGLGVDGGKGVRGKAQRKRRRQRDLGTAAAAAAEQRRQAQLELERKTGSEGLFAVINSVIGDASQAQAIKDASLGGNRAAAGGGDSAGGTNRHGHLFSGSSAGAAAKKPAPKEDRRALAQRADELAQLRHKVKRLGEMAARNSKDTVMLPQVLRALAAARAQLAGAEREQVASARAVSHREEMKRWAKF